MTNKQKVKRALKTGKVNSKKADQLQNETDIKPSRTQEPLRAIIRELIKDGLPVGSLPKYGYWIIANKSELNEVKRSLRNRINGVDDRIKAIVRAFNAYSKK
jgi:hypothetical protein